jgi:hypothetical protein
MLRVIVSLPPMPAPLVAVSLSASSVRRACLPGDRRSRENVGGGGGFCGAPDTAEAGVVRMREVRLEGEVSACAASAGRLQILRLCRTFLPAITKVHQGGGLAASAESVVTMHAMDPAQSGRDDPR